MTEIIERIGAAIMGAYEYTNSVHLLEAIWRCDNPTWLIQDGERTRTVRFTKGQLIAVEVHKYFPHITEEIEKQYIAGEIVNVTDETPANYRILATFGAATHSFTIKIEDLKTNQHHYLKL